MDINTARELGYIVDYPAHPRGEGQPCADWFGEPIAPASFARFEIDPRTVGLDIANPGGAVAGWLYDGARSAPAFLAGWDRARVLAALARAATL